MSFKLLDVGNPSKDGGCLWDPSMETEQRTRLEGQCSESRTPGQEMTCAGGLMAPSLTHLARALSVCVKCSLLCCDSALAFLSILVF